ncbi:MAG: hypothetical protein U5R49_18930 [Deltaproteobacteria bacterium]|nr:hypothetical protein [Deltaproteobacteria bacterium]
MEEEINWAETKNKIPVGSRESVRKARTSLVLSLTPMILFFRSKRSLTRFLTVRKRSSSSRITLILISAKARILLEKGESLPETKIPHTEVEKK